jgi:hypothetical protein
MSEDRPLVSFRKIQKCAQDQGIGVSDAKGFARQMDQSIAQLVAKKILKSKAGSVRFTSRGLVSARALGS